MGNKIYDREGGYVRKERRRNSLEARSEEANRHVAGNVAKGMTPKRAWKKAMGSLGEKAFKPKWMR